MKCSLTERIEIQKFGNNVQDSEGFDIGKWENYYKCWACFQAVKGKEFADAKTTQSLNIVTFTVRYCNNIKELNTKDFRVVFKGKTYNIEYIYDVNNQHNFIDIKCSCIE